MTTCVMGVLRLVRRVIRGSSAMALATGRLRFSSLASLFTLALLGTTGAVLPDASWIGYDYDGAHRQTAVYDHQGNRTEYVLDNAGNRTGENTTDPSVALKRQLTRNIDAFGRVQQTTGRE